jgi:nitrate reductase gamma subunit
VNDPAVSMLEFARGPLFRFTFALMVLGLARLVLLTVYGIVRTYVSAGDRRLLWPIIRQRTLWALFPFSRLHRARPAYSILSFAFHLGLIIVPIFLFAHVFLWKRGIGVSWPVLPPLLADVLTVLTIAAGLALFAARVGSRLSRTLSRAPDYTWPLLLTLVFATGFLASHPAWCPVDYRVTLLVHVLGAELVFVLIPFSKIAHCVLIPFSQLVSDLAWHFPPTAGIITPRRHVLTQALGQSI